MKINPRIHILISEILDEIKEIGQIKIVYFEKKQDYFLFKHLISEATRGDKVYFSCKRLKTAQNQYLVKLSTRRMKQIETNNHVFKQQKIEFKGIEYQDVKKIVKLLEWGNFCRLKVKDIDLFTKIINALAQNCNPKRKYSINLENDETSEYNIYRIQ